MGASFNIALAIEILCFLPQTKWNLLLLSLFQALWERLYKIMAAGPFSGLYHLRMGRVRFSEFDVIFNRIIKQIHLLEYHTYI